MITPVEETALWVPPRLLNWRTPTRFAMASSGLTFAYKSGSDVIGNGMGILVLRWPYFVVVSCDEVKKCSADLTLV